MIERVERFWKNCSDGWKVIIVIILMLVASAFIGWYCTRPLDRMRLYEVEVSPLEDGTLEITYHLQWEVLDDTTEGPLKEVRIGLANSHATLTGAGGDIYKPYGSNGEMSGGKLTQTDIRDRVKYSIINYPNEGHLIVFQLNRAFYKGECADFWYTVHQEKMLCDDVDSVFYDFTPGWFSEIKVQKYRFTWKASPCIRTSNEDRREGEVLVWEGSLKANGYRSMKVSYDERAFEGAERVKWRPTYVDQNRYTSQKAHGKVFSVALRSFLIIGFILFRILLPGNYRGGRGFGGRHGGSGGCACACAGCACACACAGGGRAGCSRKDFSSWKDSWEKATSSRRPGQ